LETSRKITEFLGRYIMTNFQRSLEISNIGFGAKFYITAVLNSRLRPGRKLRQF